MSTVRTSDGVDLHVEVHGAGRPLLLVGGYGTPGTAWRPQVEVLSRTHQVVVLDRRWHGRSPRPVHGHRIARHAEDVHDVLCALDLRGALAVGASMGASTLLALLDRFGADRLRGVVLVDQTPKVLNDDGWSLGWPGLTRAGLGPWLDGFPPPLEPFHTPPAPELLALTVTDPPFDLLATHPLLRDHVEADWRHVLPRVAVPLLAVAGRHSPLWPWQSSRWMADAAPLGELAVLDGSGHAPQLEEPEAFNRLLAQAADR